MMHFSRSRSALLGGLFAALLIVSACSEGGGLNIFSVQDDVVLGQQVSDEIAANPADFPLLSESAYPAAYDHLRRIRDEILDNADVSFAAQFGYPVYLVEDDDVLNAFCTPGGHIYVYTGLIKFLDSEDELAGVMGHEIAHAALRHTTDQLTRAYGLELLLAIVLGDGTGSDLATIATGLLTLSFSRNNENQSDEYSVRYLCPTEYDARGAARFFEKLGTASTPAFLSTHPNPEDRVANITGFWTELGCGEGGTFEARYLDFKNSLP